MTHADCIQQTIKESKQYNKIGHTNIIGDRGDLRAAIQEAWDGEFDMAELDYPGEGYARYDVWGWADETDAPDEMTWRIYVTLHE